MNEKEANRIQNWGEQHPQFHSKEMRQWRKDKKVFEENERIYNLFQAFQNFQRFLSLPEMKLIRRNLMAIEKTLFGKGGEGK